MLANLSKTENKQTNKRQQQQQKEKPNNQPGEKGSFFERFWSGLQYLWKINSDGRGSTVAPRIQAAGKCVLRRKEQALLHSRARV